MLVYSSRMRKQLSKPTNGFSLLELIIVLVIIGVMVAAITTSIADTRGDKLRLEARRLAARISLARDEAIITNQEFGLEVNHDRYRFLYLDEEEWQVYSTADDKQFAEQKIPEDMDILLKVEGLFAQYQQSDDQGELFKESQVEGEKKKLRPQIYLMSSGEINPFTIVIGYDDDSPVFYQLDASYNGKITLEGPTQESMSVVLNRIQGSRQ